MQEKDLEIVEIYPHFMSKNKEKGSGTFHVFYIPLAMDLRGLAFTLKGTHVHIRMPTTKFYDLEEKQKIQAPLVGFLDKEKQKTFFGIIIKLFKKYLETYEAPSYVPEKYVPKENRYEDKGVHQKKAHEHPAPRKTCKPASPYPPANRARTDDTKL